MPRVKQVTARKDYPTFGIKKGDKHFHWKLMTGPRSSREFRQLAPPKPSQLTSSEFLGNLYAIEEQIADATQDESLPDTIRELGENLRELGTEQRDKYDNMPEGLQQGSTGCMLEERADNCESYADSLDEVADQLQSDIEEIQGMEWNDLDDFADYDLEEGDEQPTEDEIESARLGQMASLFEKAIEDAGQCSPGF